MMLDDETNRRVVDTIASTHLLGGQAAAVIAVTLIVHLIAARAGTSKEAQERAIDAIVGDIRMGLDSVQRFLETGEVSGNVELVRLGNARPN